MAKVVCVLYDDPVDGYPTNYARDGLPKLERYAGGQTLPTPKAIDFQPGALLGSAWMVTLMFAGHNREMGHLNLIPESQRSGATAANVGTVLLMGLSGLAGPAGLVLNFLAALLTRTVTAPARAVPPPLPAARISS